MEKVRCERCGEIIDSNGGWCDFCEEDLCSDCADWEYDSSADSWMCGNCYHTREFYDYENEEDY